jgi:DNA adenine methylase
VNDFAEHLQAPFPYFGGKSRVAEIVWARFGDVDNYVEPFFGSGAVLLARPQTGKIERTLLDLMEPAA